MSPVRVLAVVRKELHELFRDRITMTVCVLMPLAFLFLFGYSITLEVENVRLGVLDGDQTALSRSLVDRFVASRSFSLARELRSTHEVEAGLQSSAFKVALIIPPGFSARMARGETAWVQLLADGTHAATAQLSVGHAQAIVESFPAPRRPAIRTETRIRFNSSLRSFDYIVPGLYAVILMALPPLLTALAIVREKETGSIQQIYASSLTSAEFVAGKLVPYAGLALVQLVAVAIVGYAWFRVPFRGSPALFLGAGLLYVLSTVGIGLLVSVVTRTQLVAMLVALILTMMPSFLYSGFLFPIFTMPAALQVYSRLFPASYFTEVSRGVVLRGASLDALWPSLAAIAVYTVLVFLLAAWRLRMKVA